MRNLVLSAKSGTEKLRNEHSVAEIVLANCESVMRFNWKG